MKRETIFKQIDFPTISEGFSDWIKANGFFISPASTKYHGCCEGGLFDHSLAVMNALILFTEDNSLTWQREESPYIVGMFHDLCKIDQYELVSHPQDLDVTYRYRTDTALKGHGEKSVMLLAQFMTLTEEEIMCIRYHMGAFVEKYEWNDYTMAVKRFPNVLWTHHADMIATHVMGR